MKLKYCLDRQSTLENQSNNAIAVIVILIIGGLILSLQSSNAEKNTLEEENYELQQRLDDYQGGYQEALSEANFNIEQCNDSLNNIMSEVQSISRIYPWSSYQDMGNILEDLPGLLEAYSKPQDLVGDPF